MKKAVGYTNNNGGHAKSCRGKAPPVLAVISPCYNEEEVFNISLERLLGVLSDLQESGKCSPDSFLVFVDDGSLDATWDLIRTAARQHPDKVRGVRLTRNFGHQAALMAGFEYVRGKCDIAITIDIDLQDDVGIMGRMIDKYCEGNEIVLGVRSLRDTDSLFKRLTAILYYRLMILMGVNLVENHADYRLLSAKILNYLESYTEYHLFLRAYVLTLHDRVATVTYDRASRAAGKSKYSLTKMLRLGWDGITSFTVVPLRMIMIMGAIIFLVSTIFAIYSLIEAAMGNTVPGWASIIISIYMLGGLVMLSLGIIGEYIGKIFIQVKNRPRYLIDEIVEPGNRKGVA